MKKVCSKLLLLVMVFSLFSPVGKGTAAEEAYDGYVYVTVERFTLGQGVAQEPVKLGYYEEDSLDDVLKRGLGEKLIYEESQWGTYISGYKDGGEPEGWTTDSIPAEVKGLLGETLPDTMERQNAACLMANDYVDYSGFMSAVDNAFTNVGMSDVFYSAEEQADTYHNGSVVRLQFSLVYGDLDIAPSDYGTPVISFANKDGIIRELANAAAQKNTPAYKEALAVLEDWDAEGEEVAEAENRLSRLNRLARYEEQYGTCISYLKEQMAEPSYGGEWIVFTAARSGVQDVAWYKGYVDHLVETLKNGEFGTSKSTEYSKAVIALTSIGADASDFAGTNLVSPLTDYEFVKKSGVNGAVYALIALDCGNYEAAETDTGLLTEEQTGQVRKLLVEDILSRAVTNGGWTYFGDTADVDMTAMAVVALAPYYNKLDGVKEAVDSALSVLSEMQEENGGFASYGTANCESCAQVLCALTALGIDAEADERFVKNDRSVVDAMLSYYDKATGGFRHTADGKVNLMASVQAGYALVSYDRWVKGATGLYEMSDAACLYQCGEHTWNQGTVAEEATIEKEGKLLITCTVCGMTKEERIPKKETPVEKPADSMQQATGGTENQPPAGTVNLPGTGQTETGEKETACKLKKLTSPKKKQVKVTWKKVAGVTGYEVQVSASSKFKKAGLYKVSGEKKTGRVIKSLKPGKKYYVRVRTYTVTKKNGKKKTVYGKWSAKKTVRIK